jgi:hypothetical protein
MMVITLITAACTESEYAESIGTSQPAQSAELNRQPDHEKVSGLGCVQHQVGGRHPPAMGWARPAR